MKRSIWLVLCLLLAMGVTAYAQDNTLATDGTPTSAAVTLGGDSWLDPFVISVSPANSVTGDAVDASTLDSGCKGFIASSPTVSLDWTPPHDMGTMRIFFVSTSDATLVVVKPDGKYACNDDFTALNTNPGVAISDPVAGKYQIFVGTAQQDGAASPGFLVITSSELSPLTLDLNKLIASPLRELPLRIPLAVLLASRLPRISGATADLTTGFDPVTADVTGGGGIAAFDVELGNPNCTGFVDVLPTFVFNWSGDPQNVRVLFEGDNDLTLVILGPDRRAFCSDDTSSENLNPSADIPVEEGRYSIFIGTDDPASSATGKLTITSDLSAEPAALAPSNQPQ